MTVTVTRMRSKNCGENQTGNAAAAAVSCRKIFRPDGRRWSAWLADPGTARDATRLEPQPTTVQQIAVIALQCLQCGVPCLALIVPTSERARQDVRRAVR